MELTEPETRKKIQLFFLHNTGKAERVEYLKEVYKGWKYDFPSEQIEVKKNAFYFLTHEEETVKEGMLSFEEAEEKITQFLDIREYAELESVSEMLLEQKSEEERDIEAQSYEEEEKQEKKYKKELLKTCLLEYKQGTGIRAMLFDVFTGNQPLEKKAKVLRAFWLYDKEEKVRSYSVWGEGGNCEITMTEQQIIMERYLESGAIAGRNLVMDWQEAAGAVEKLFIEDEIPLSQQDTWEEARKAVQVTGFAEFFLEYQAFMETEGVENASGISKTFLEQYENLLGKVQLHQEIRKQAVEALAQADVLVPDMLLIYEMFQIPEKSKEEKTQFIQCLFTEGKWKSRFMLKSDIFLEGKILDDRIALTYYPEKDRYANQVVFYGEIAEEIQNQIERKLYLSEQELRFYQSVGKEFCTPEAVRLFEEFLPKQEPSRRERTREELEKTQISTEIENKEAEPVTKELDGVADFFYSDDWHLPDGGAKTRFQNNMEAICTLYQIDKEKRAATKQEQEILSRYVGWGGLQNAFNGKDMSWQKEYQELKQLLSKEEYQKARATVLTSFYTPKEVLEGIYHAIQRMGFQGGKVLEPALGIGNFYHAVPKELRDATELYGVELDSISGRIAQYLHPSANIQIRGFEETNFEENSFDLILGNVPFGDYKPYDPKYKNKKLKIHDYFIMKSLDLLKPGGILAVVTSKGTLDKSNNRIRKELAEQADLLGAVRLPKSTFAKNANTGVTSDILFFLQKNKLKMVIAFFLSVLKICITLLLPIISMRILDSAIPNHNFREVVFMAIGILSFTLCQSVISYILETIYAKIGKAIYLEYQKKVLTHFISLSGEYYSNMKFGEAYNTIYEDIERIQGLISGNIFQFLIDVISSIGVLIILFFMQWDLALLLVILLPIIYICQRYFQFKGREMASILREKDGELIGILGDVISNIIPFHYSRCKEFFIKKYNNFVNRSKDSEISLQLLSVKNRGILSFLAQLFSIVVIGYGGIKVISNDLTIGALIAFNMYGNQMVSPILNISGVLMNLQTNLVSLDRVQQFLKLQSIDLKCDGLILENVDEIKISNMDFSYGESNILNKFNARFLPNTITMIVGESGSGKSTILSILYRFWNCKAGKLLINNVEINKFSVESLREQITIVSQDMYLFNDTIRNNLIMNQQKTDEELSYAVKIACFDQILEQLPKGLDTVVGEGGIRFSGGERQRMCLTRALLRNTPVLILDEATSALDQVTEQRILENIKANISGKTVIMITHRMENCKLADNIIVLKDGTDIASGKHETLLMCNQYYRNLYNRNYME